MPDKIREILTSTVCKAVFSEERRRTFAPQKGDISHVGVMYKERLRGTVVLDCNAQRLTKDVLGRQSRRVRSTDIPGLPTTVVG